jgi:hypothetical protein
MDRDVYSSVLMVDAVEEGFEGALSLILRSDGFHKIMSVCIRVFDDVIAVAKT